MTKAKTTTYEIDYIVKTPGVLSGSARIRDHRLSVELFATYYLSGDTPEEIAAAYEGITVAHVHAALSYYYDNQEEIDAEIAETERLFKELREGKLSTT